MATVTACGTGAPLASQMTAEFAILGRERLVQGGRGQVHVAGDDDRSEHETMDGTNLILTAVRRQRDTDGSASLRDDDAFDLMAGEAVEDSGTSL